MLKTPITAIILAGGKSSRMQYNDKGLLLLKCKPLFKHVIDKIKPQVNEIIINCNQNETQYSLAGYPIIKDELPGFLGPLAGIYSGLVASNTQWNLIVSCDTPFLPADLVSKLFTIIGHANAGYVVEKEKSHPTVLLINKNQIVNIKDALEKGERKLLIYLKKINAKPIKFYNQKDSFVNINTPEDLAYWEAKL
ncbi:molybdenum cofactor guanylyltransferase MobA [Orbaceae bacterium ac157xtp]